MPRIRSTRRDAACVAHYMCAMVDFPSISNCLIRPRASTTAPSSEFSAWLGRNGANEVRRLLRLCPRHQVTALMRLDALAGSLNVGGVHVKDESNRLGLGSFKALGGAYAVAELVLGWASERLQRDIAPNELVTDAVKYAVADRTVCCATDGNHGRSVAAAARLYGCKAVIFVHQRVAQERRALLSALDADVVEVAGTYDDSVDECARRAAANDWQVVSDTSWRCDETIPARVMQGYSVLIDEALAQMPVPPTHVFIQGGVGGLAGAVAGYLANSFESARPKLIVVEPDLAACLMASAVAGSPTEIEACASTVMAMLECYRPSEAAWPLLDAFVDAFMTVPEDAAQHVVKLLEAPTGNDPAILTTESGCAGLAGLIAVVQDQHVRTSLELDHKSQILTVITEGRITL
jgi:diaminopropionate ammonia-lyase